MDGPEMNTHRAVIEAALHAVADSAPSEETPS